MKVFNFIYIFKFLVIFIDIIEVDGYLVFTFYNESSFKVLFSCQRGMRNITLKMISVDCYPLQDFEGLWENPDGYSFEASISHKCSGHLELLMTNQVFKKNNLLLEKEEQDGEKRRENQIKNVNKNEKKMENEKKGLENSNKNFNKKKEKTKREESGKITSPHQKNCTVIIPAESVYLFNISYEILENEEQNGTVSKWVVEYTSKYGFLFPNQWPLLIFYQVSLFVYVVYLVVWVVLCLVFRKDLLQLQYYIAAVILLGLIEKAIFVSEYEFLNRYGVKNSYGLVVFGEVFSALKRASARFIVIIVSVGFGIVKPRLGKTLYYLVALCSAYFLFASIEGVYMREHQLVLRRGSKLVITFILVAIDTIIIFWIFSSLLDTIRKLRVRRNAIKIAIYKHFSYTLFISVFASLVYVVWCAIVLRRSMCITNWRLMWVDMSFWPCLFMFILLLLIILWRPSANNNRYAYSSLVDEGDEELEEPMIPESRGEGIKQRGKGEGVQSTRKEMIDPVKWVEENIPKGGEKILSSMLDSDDEIEDTLFEINKMQ